MAFFFFFFFFHRWTGYAFVQLQGVGVKGKDSGNKDFAWMKDGLLPITFDPVSVWPQPTGSFAGRPSGSNPTWKCHCTDYLRCGTAHSGDGGGMAEAKVSRQAAWLAGCLVWASCLPWRSVSAIVLPHWEDFISPQKNTEKGESQNTLCKLMAGSSMET